MIILTTNWSLNISDLTVELWRKQLKKPNHTR